MSDIKTNEKKRACLLHFEGLEFQDVFYNIPGANVEPANGIDVFDVAITDEKFEKFLVRLRQQTNKCQLHDKDEALIDQIAEKCSSNELRKKLYKPGM